LRLSSTNLAFNAGLDGQVNPQEVSLTTGSPTVTWGAVSPQSWITITPSSGQGPANLRITLTPQGGNPGLFSGKVTVTASSGTANSPQVINVALVVGSSAGDPPRLNVDPGTLQFNVEPFSGLSAAQSLLIANVGGGTLDWTLLALQPWIQVSQTEGSGNAQQVEVRIDASAMPNGTQTGLIRVTEEAGSNPSTIQIVAVAASGGDGFVRANLDTSSPGSAGRVDGYDVVAIIQGVPTGDPRFDINQDGEVNTADVDMVLSLMGSAP
jgi:hypothetical protein